MQNPTLGTPGRRQVIQPQPTTVERSRLSWTGMEADLTLSGDNELKMLSTIKNTVLAIRREFQVNTDPKIHLNPLNRNDFNRRLLLAENQIQGLMRRKINLRHIQTNGQRSLDYTTLLNEKQNQVVELQKKIQNLEFQLRKSSAREIQLQLAINKMYDELRIKEEIINGKNEIILAEVASANAFRDAMNQIRRNVDMNKLKIPQLDKIVFDNVNLPELGTFEVRTEMLLRGASQPRTRTFQELSQGQQFKTRVVQLFREVQRVINSQQGQITEVQFQRILQGFILSSQKQSRIYEKSMIAAKRANIEENYQRLRENFAIAAGIYHQNLQKLKRDNPTVRINFERNLFELLQQQDVRAYQVQNGTVFIDAYTQKTVEVPVQDARTKHLIHLLSTTMKKLMTKFPQLSKQIDPKLCEFFQQEMIDIIEVDEVDKLVNIVKFVPQVVRVDNVYAYSSERSRKVEFHLRVLIKALLEELTKIKMKTGVVLEMDEGVINMMKAEIMDVVNVDDILKVFRSVPKIVEVEKIVEKIVEKRVEVPMVVPITKQVEKIVEVQKIVEVEKIVNVPLQIPVIQTQVVQKIVPIEQIIHQVIEVPTIVEKIIYVTQEVPKVVTVEVAVQKIVQVQKVVEVQRVVNHIQQQVQQVQIVKEKIIPVEKIIEKIVEVPVIKEKIVERIVEVPTVQIVEKIVEKAVPIVEYRKALEVSNHIETIHKPVDRIVQKIVPVIKTIERIVQVPQVIEKVVEVVHEKVIVQQVEVIREKLIKEEVIKPVEKIVKELVEVVRQVPVEVEKIIEIPVVHEVVKKVQEIVERPLIERVENTIVKEVYLRDPMIVREPKLVEVEKIINHYVEVPKPVKYIEEKIIEIPRNVDRIKEVRVQVDKIVQKMVEVPKVVQVEKIVEKIVVVPRVIEKIVEVPQIIEKIVQKEVQKIVVRDVERIVQVPVIQQRIVEVEVVKNVYIEVEKPVDRVVDKLITITNTQQKIVTEQIRVQNTVEVLCEVPKTMYVDKIVPAYYEQVKPVQIEKVVIVPRQIAVPVQVVVEKIIPVRQILEKIIQVPQFIEKVVETKQESVKIEYIEKIVEKIVVDERVKEVEKIVPYIQEVIKQIPTIVEKIVTVESKVQEIITAQQIVEKIVQRSTTIPRIYEVQKVVPKLIKVPEIIEVQRIIPQVIKVNEYIQRIVEKIVQVPRIIEKIRQIEVQKEKVVNVTNVKSEIVQVQRIVEKIAILQQMKEVIKNVNHVEKVIKIVEQIEKSPIQVAVKEQILVEIPYILEKIVQKVVIMPQIVQVLRYVHEVAESNELLVVENQKQFEAHELKLMQVMRNLRPAVEDLKIELGNLKNFSQLESRVAHIQNFLAQFQKLVEFPKLVRIKGKDENVRKIVQTEEKIVRVPVESQYSLRKQISMSLLAEKLILELKRIASKTNVQLELDQDIKLLFFPELRASSRYMTEGPLRDTLNKYAQDEAKLFDSLGSWARQNELMLHSILQERFKLNDIIDQAYTEINKAQMEYDNLAIQLHQQTQANVNCQEMLNTLKMIFNSFPREKQQNLPQIRRFIEEVERRKAQIQPLRGEQTQYLTSQVGLSQVVDKLQSKLRQKQATIENLKSTLATRQRSSLTETKTRQKQDYIRELQSQLQASRSRSSLSQPVDYSGLQETYKRDLYILQQRNAELQMQNSMLRTQLDNTKRELKTYVQNERFLMRKDDLHKVEEGSSMQGSGIKYQSFLGHSEIKRAEGSFLSQSQYSIYQPRAEDYRQDYRQSPSTLLKGVQLKEEPKLSTPFEPNKYRSPYSTDIKYTQSFLKQESMTGQSPQGGRTIFTTPASIKQEKEGDSQQSKQQSELKGSQMYRYYYSPQDRTGPKKEEPSK